MEISRSQSKPLHHHGAKVVLSAMEYQPTTHHPPLITNNQLILYTCFLHHSENGILRGSTFSWKLKFFSCPCLVFTSFVTYRRNSIYIRIPPAFCSRFLPTSLYLYKYNPLAVEKPGALFFTVIPTTSLPIARFLPTATYCTSARFLPYAEFNRT